MPGRKVEQARAASQFSSDQTVQVTLEGKTDFTGYDQLEDTASVIALFKDGEEAEVLSAGDAGVVILDKTPFYAESGGQVGDTGSLKLASGGEFAVSDTRKQGGDLFGHFGQVANGELRVGDQVSADVNSDNRQSTARTLSDTPVACSITQDTGDHVQQKVQWSMQSVCVSTFHILSR